MDMDDNKLGRLEYPNDYPNAIKKHKDSNNKIIDKKINVNYNKPNTCCYDSDIDSILKKIEDDAKKNQKKKRKRMFKILLNILLILLILIGISCIYITFKSINIIF